MEMSYFRKPSMIGRIFPLRPGDSSVGNSPPTAQGG